MLCCNIAFPFPEKYFLFLKEVSADNLSKRLNSLRHYKDVNSSNFKSAFYSIVKNSHLLNELKRVLKEHVTNERLFLEFNSKNNLIISPTINRLRVLSDHFRIYLSANIDLPMLL